MCNDELGWLKIWSGSACGCLVAEMMKGEVHVAAMVKGEVHVAAMVKDCGAMMKEQVHVAELVVNDYE